MNKNVIAKKLVEILNTEYETAEQMVDDCIKVDKLATELGFDDEELEILDGLIKGIVHKEFLLKGEE